MSTRARVATGAALILAVAVLAACGSGGSPTAAGPEGPGASSAAPAPESANVDQSGGDVADHTEYLGASSGSASFTTTISTVSPDDVPAPPADGTCGFSSDDGVVLSWSPPSQGPSVSDYDLYESVAGLEPPVFYVNRVNGTSYDDESAVTKGHDADILPYYVYAVWAASSAVRFAAGTALAIRQW